MNNKDDQEFDTPGFFIDTNDDDDVVQEEDDDVERFWDKMYRVCTKELINQGMQFDKLKAKIQLQQMIKKNDRVKSDLIAHHEIMLEREMRNKSFLSQCFQRYMLSFQIFQEVSQPDFYENNKGNDDQDEDD